MKFQGKGYYEYVHHQLNASLENILEQPLDEEVTTEIGDEIIREIATERVITADEEIEQRTNIVNPGAYGLWIGSNAYMILTAVVNKVHLPLDIWLNTHTYLKKTPIIIAGIIGSSVAFEYYQTRRKLVKEIQDNMMNRFKEITPEANERRRNKKVVFTSHSIAVDGRSGGIYYDLGLQRKLYDVVNENFDKATKEIRKIQRTNILGIVLSTVFVGYMCGQTAVGIGAGIVSASMYYINEGTYKKAYYQRKIDEGIQRIVDEYKSQGPNKPEGPLHLA